MAIFWKHIKGTGNLTTGNSGLWTWIKWSNGEGAKDSTPGTLSTSMLCSPEIWTNSANGQDYTGGKNLGHIITSNATDMEILQPIRIHTIIAGTTQEGDTGLIIKKTNKNDNILSFTDNCIIPAVTIKQATTGEKYSLDINGNFKTTGIIEVTNPGHIDSPYFNATSDKRAKDNLSPLLTNALDIINNVHVYTFNYKNNPDDKTIGVIAQEFLDKKLDGVSLVANEAATGEDGDYMTIKETKLIYLLLKGMQEQQEEINLLKQHIEQLESK